MPTTPTFLLLAWLGVASAAEPDPEPPLVLREAPPLPGEALGDWIGLAPASPPEPDALDLGEVLDLALGASARLAEARARQEAAGQAARAAGRPGNPTLELEVAPEGSLTHLEARLELPVTDLLVAPMRARTARSGADAAGLRASEEGARLALDVGRAWFDLVAAEERLRLGQQALDALAAAADLATARQVSGSGTALERAAHQATYASARGEVAALELARQGAMAALQGASGLSAAELAAPLALAFPSLPDRPPLPPGLEEEATRRSLGLAAGRAEVVGLQRQAALARVEGRIPALALELGGSRSVGAAPGHPEPVALAAAAHISLPLFDRGTRAGAALTLEATAEQARLDALDDRVRAAARQVSDRLRTAHARARHGQQVVLPAWAEVSRQTLLAYNAMQVDAYALLSARRQELDAALALVDDQHAYWIASLELDALMAGALPDLAQATASAAPGGPPAPSGGH